MNRKPQLIDSVVPRQATKPQTSITPPAKQPRRGNIDGIVSGKHGPPRQQSQTQHQPQIKPEFKTKPKPHLQQHPMLQRLHQQHLQQQSPRIVNDIAPAAPPSHPAVQPAQPKAKARPILDIRTKQPNRSDRSDRADRSDRQSQAIQRAPNTNNAAQSDQPKSRAQPIKHRATQSKPQLRQRTSTLAVIAVTAGIVFGFLSFFDLRLGYAVIAVYALVVLLRRLPSRLTFLLALAMFGGIIITQALAPDSGLSENMAVYAFLLLCIGTVSLAIEVRRDGLYSGSGE